MSLQVYDDFGKAGYSLTNYNEKWMTPNGLGEMAVEDTRSFSGGRFHLSAVCVLGTGYSPSWTRSRFSTQKHQI